MKQMSSIQSRVRKVEYDFTDAKLTGCGGVTFAAQLAKASGLCELLEKELNGTLKKRRRGATEAQSILAQVYLLLTGEGHLSDLDDARRDGVFRVLTGLGELPGSRRMGEFLSRFGESDLARFRELAVRWLGPLTATVANRHRCSLGYVPVFIDSTDIEVDGKCFEGAQEPCYRGVRRYQMHTIFVGNLMVSLRLNDGGGHSTHGWKEQLEADAVPLLSGESGVWVRADNAYYKGDFVKYCRSRGWDYSVSVTNDNWKKPVVNAVKDSDNADWQWINGEEQAIYSSHRPNGWEQDAAYAVIRRSKEGRQLLLDPTYTVILVSHDELPVWEAVARHRGKQGQENAFKGPLIDLDLHHPPCKRFAANQAFYLCGLLAQALLRAIQYCLLPLDEWRRSLGTIIRRVVRRPAVLTCSAGRYRLRFSKNLRSVYMKWLNEAIDNTCSLKRILLE